MAKFEGLTDAELAQEIAISERRTKWPANAGSDMVAEIEAKIRLRDLSLEAKNRAYEAKSRQRVSLIIESATDREG